MEIDRSDLSLETLLDSLVLVLFALIHSSLDPHSKIGLLTETCTNTEPEKWNKVPYVEKGIGLCLCRGSFM
jgi:hypothetical protein